MNNMGTTLTHDNNRLSLATLNALPASIAKPNYDRTKVTPGIVHIGVGGFHRAHEALYIDRLLNLGKGKNWGIIGLGLMDHDKVMAGALKPQDCLYTLIEQDQRGSTARVVGSILDFIHAPSAPEDAMRVLCAPTTKIVSLTITEGGYNIDQATGKFLSGNPKISAEAKENRTESMFGYVVNALAARRGAGIQPFTILSCDNLVHNGDVAKHAICEFASLKDPDLSKWISHNVSFPNTMVDRITPVTSAETRELATSMLGVDDAWPVASESFIQWVVEDKFCNGRPELEAVGVQITSDVTPYEVMKIRLLNAGHSAIGYLGHLCNLDFIFEIMKDQDFQHFLRKFWNQEVSPHVSEVAGINLEDYKQSLFDRFSNPNIKDQTLRICSDGSNKLPKFLLPTIREALEKDEQIELMSLVVASWIRFMSGTDEDGAEIPLNDPRAEIIKPLALRGVRDPLPVLNNQEIFGDLAQDHRFVEAVRRALSSLYDKGARETLRSYINRD